jgi:hypothetical protein
LQIEEAISIDEEANKRAWFWVVGGQWLDQKFQGSLEFLLTPQRLKAFHNHVTCIQSLS